MTMDDNSHDQVIDSSAFQRARGLFVTTSTRLAGNAVEALATEVIARLSSRRVLPLPDGSPVPEVVIDDRLDRQIERLCSALLGVDESAATEVVMETRAMGFGVEVLYLGLLAEGARRLGTWWEEDRVSSLEVVIAAGRIYAIMRGLRRLFGPGLWRGERFRAVFASVPGETHVLGAAMAADLLTLHGWEIDLRAGLGHDQLVQEVGLSAYPIIGLTASSTRMLFPLARLIVALRVSNPGSWIMVSGGIVDLEPEVANMVDADAAARDLTTAEMMMEAFVGEVKGEMRR